MQKPTENPLKLYNFISPAGGDYTPVTTDLTFNSTNAAIPQTVTIPILDDLLLEGSEGFNVTLTTNNSTTTLYILPDVATVTIEDVDGKLHYSVGLLSTDYREGNMISNKSFFPHIQRSQLVSSVPEAILWLKMLAVLMSQ